MSKFEFLLVMIVYFEEITSILQIATVDHIQSQT